MRVDRRPARRRSTSAGTTSPGPRDRRPRRRAAGHGSPPTAPARARRRRRAGRTTARRSAGLERRLAGAGRRHHRQRRRHGPGQDHRPGASPRPAASSTACSPRCSASMVGDPADHRRSSGCSTRPARLVWRARIWVAYLILGVLFIVVGAGRSAGGRPRLDRAPDAARPGRRRTPANPRPVPVGRPRRTGARPEHHDPPTSATSSSSDPARPGSPPPSTPPGPTSRPS